MIERALNFQLPEPWVNSSFSVSRIGAINFLVGPNGSGKSRFAAALKERLPRCRLLGTDRLAAMEKSQGLGMFGENFKGGVQKGWFPNLKGASDKFGSGIDAIVILEERMDLRVRVEATLAHLFDREIILQWDSGNLIPKARLGKTGTVYRLDSDECHGIKELLVLLTHLYNEDHHYLIIDEPELNLHPQFQAFLLQEIRQVAGDPDKTAGGKKGIFLITHSPFMIDLRSTDDLRAIISFDLKYNLPRQISDLDVAVTNRLSTLVPRLNVHHKQLFFSDNPIFVEGILDAQMILAIQEQRGFSVASAGSCVIDAGGSGEVNKYLELCVAFGKTAYFIYDLDSLFSGNLRDCLKEDYEIKDFLATIGVGADFGGYCGVLDRALTDAIQRIRTADPPPPALDALRTYLEKLAGGSEFNKRGLARARVAILVQLARDRGALTNVLSTNELNNLDGRITQIATVLAKKNVFLLKNGALEHSLPLYSGNMFDRSDEAKNRAVLGELAFLGERGSETDLRNRYGELYRAVSALPGRSAVPIDQFLRGYLSDYIHHCQQIVVRYADWDLPKIQAAQRSWLEGIDRLFTLEEFKRNGTAEFSAVIRVKGIGGEPSRTVRISDRTNAGMGDFRFEN